MLNTECGRLLQKTALIFPFHLKNNAREPHRMLSTIQYNDFEMGNDKPGIPSSSSEHIETNKHGKLETNCRNGTSYTTKTSGPFKCYGKNAKAWKIGAT